MWNSKGNSTTMKMMTTIISRHFSTKSRARAPNLRKINPRVPFQEAASIAEDLYAVIKTNGPLTIANAWNHAKDGGISGISSKTHMKLLLKWMQGKHMLKQLCHHVGSSKKFFLTTLPDGPELDPSLTSMDMKIKSGKRQNSNKKKA